MKKINAIILLSSLTSASVFAGAYVENREAYNLASDQGEVMLRVGYNFDMGAGIMLTNTYNFQREDELKHGYNEIEGWYPLFKPTDKLTIQPGGLINDKSIGSGGAVYLDVNYKFVPLFIVTIKHLQINDEVYGLKSPIFNIYLDNIALLVGAMLFN